MWNSFQLLEWHNPDNTSFFHELMDFFELKRYERKFHLFRKVSHHHSIEVLHRAGKYNTATIDGQL
jgi:hypothetical protein